MCRRPSVRVTRCILHQPEAQRANASLTSGYTGSGSVWWALPELCVCVCGPDVSQSIYCLHSLHPFPLVMKEKKLPCFMTILIQRKSGSDHVTESSRGSVKSLCVANSDYAAENKTGMARSVIYWTFTRRLWVAPSVIPPPPPGSVGHGCDVGLQGFDKSLRVSMQAQLS